MRGYLCVLWSHENAPCVGIWGGRLGKYIQAMPAYMWAKRSTTIQPMGGFIGSQTLVLFSELLGHFEVTFKGCPDFANIADGVPYEQ